MDEGWVGIPVDNVIWCANGVARWGIPAQGAWGGAIWERGTLDETHEAGIRGDATMDMVVHSSNWALEHRGGIRDGT